MIQRLLLPALCLIVGCTAERPLDAWRLASASSDAPGVLIPANQTWVDTGIDIVADQSVTVHARGEILPHAPDRRRHATDCAVKPQGVYLAIGEQARQQFPVPTASVGPAPSYCLIGRIGEGAPFFVGEHKSWTADRTGRLYLGINDDNPQDNSGQFIADVALESVVQPVAHHELVSAEEVGVYQGPAPNSSVVVFYVDGLRPDVVQEMAAMGHLPNIRRLFVDGGTWMENTFAVFPSDTITSNGTMWTGCFSDRHGIKGQVRFRRSRQESESYLEPLGPNRSAKLLSSTGINGAIHQVGKSTVEMTQGTQAANDWAIRECTSVPTLSNHLRSQGSDWATGVLPIMTEAPPVLWTRSMARYLPYFQTNKAPYYIDDANTDYARRYLLPRNAPVTVVWLPETDTVSHKCCRGQFGATRPTIVAADRMIGDIAADLEAAGRFNSTYFILVSDHGHLGGNDRHLQHFDLTHEFLFAPRHMTADGQWVGGGLGLSVRQHRSISRHPEHGAKEFVFVDGQSDGTARIFLPKGHFQSQDWSGPNQPADLLSYRIAPHLPAINLIDSLLQCQATNSTGESAMPIDLVLMKVDPSTILVSTADRGQAVIQRHRDEQGKWRYRYQMVDQVAPRTDGSIAWSVVEFPKVDPLRLLEFLPRQAIEYDLDEESWLQLTAKGPYPDGVVALARHVLWEDRLNALEQDSASDLVVTAKNGWLIGTDPTPGTTHGYPLFDSMRASWFISGPNIRRGARVESAARLADLTPTILHLLGTDTAPLNLDGMPRQMMFEPRKSPEMLTASYRGGRLPTTVRDYQPIYWHDVDLAAWESLDYQPRPQSPFVPRTVNRPESMGDLNNILYAAVSVTEQSPWRLIDDVTSPLHPGTYPLRDGISAGERRWRTSTPRWAGDAAPILDISGLSLNDYTWSSAGNLQRMSRGVDWIQSRAESASERTDELLEREGEHPVGATMQTAVDKTQFAIWDAYRFAQRVMMKVLDETMLNGMENTADRMLNARRKVPAEVIVQP
ncbi:MAG: alkaline phosphatase family protein [Planctomycetaceae bacterium]